MVKGTYSPEGVSRKGDKSEILTWSGGQGVSIRGGEGNPEYPQLRRGEQGVSRWAGKGDI